MPQFAVYLNKNLKNRAFFPLLVDVQSTLLEDLETRVVIPLAKAAGFSGFPLRLVMPSVAFEGERYVLMTPQLAGVSRTDLGSQMGGVPAHAQAIYTATDLLLRGF
jgi:toxin CcdB